VANPRFATAKIMGDMEEASLHVISSVKTWLTGYGNPGNTTQTIHTSPHQPLHVELGANWNQHHHQKQFIFSTFTNKFTMEPN
jgi:hypothetical protein